MIDPNRVVDIPIVVDIDTESPTGIMDRGSYIYNGQVDYYFDKRTYVTQRPAIVLNTIASDTVSDTAGRGLYYWEEQDNIYLVNNSGVYKGNYSSVGTITAGRDKVHFATNNQRLIIIDSSNNEGWVINTSDSLSKISDTDFPTSLAGGVVVLDGFTFVMDTEGTIYQSDLGDPTAWNALNFIEAEREQDGGVFITRHHDSIVAVGRRTIEFLYNKANPTGSVLGRRDDIYFKVGGATPNGFVTNGDDLFFVGTNETGNIGVYTIINYKLEKISTTTIDNYLSHNILNLDKEVIVSTQTIGGKAYYLITVCTEGQGTYIPDTTLVFDQSSKLWHLWETKLNGHTHFPLVQSSVRTTSEAITGRGIFLNGDLYSPRYDLVPIDSTDTSSYFVSGYAQEDYSSSGSSTNSNIEFDLVTNPLDSGGRYYKFMHSLELLLNYNLGDSLMNLELGLSDDYYSTYNTYSISTSRRRKLTRLGRFSRRNFRVSYAGDRTLKLEKLEAVVDNGEH